MPPPCNSTFSIPASKRWCSHRAPSGPITGMYGLSPISPSAFRNCRHCPSRNLHNPSVLVIHMAPCRSSANAHAPRSSDAGCAMRWKLIDEVIFAVDSGKLSQLEDLFLLCDEQGVRTRVVLNFFPHVNSKVYLDQLDALPLLTFSAAPHDEIRLLAKRATDVLLAAAALFLLFPFMAAIALLIRLTSPGPVIFRHTRCGLNGRRFTFYKFRSMCDGAEEMKASLIHLYQWLTD